MKKRLRSLDAWVVAASLMALVLLGPLREAFAALPVVLFASALVLFVAPGMLLAHWLMRDRFSGAALAPISFAFSAGLFGLLAVPALVLHKTLELYMQVCGAILAVFLVVAVIRIVRLSGATGERPGVPAEPWTWLLWLPFLSLGGVLAFLSRLKAPILDGDTWDYIAWVREFLTTDRLALYDPYLGTRISEFSRVKINGWLLEQAALSHLTGIDPLVLVLKYLTPALVILTFLAFYALARVLFKSATAALLAGCLYCLFFLVFLDVSHWTFGSELISRIVQDKFVARYIFLPVALCLAVAFLEERKFRYLALFGFMCWAVVSVHPAGLAIIGLSMTGFGLVRVMVGWRQREVWTGMMSLGAALLSILIVPLAYALITGKQLSSELYSADISGTNPVVLANMVFVLTNKNIWDLGNGLYMMHPAVVLNPVVATAYLLGCPFLIWRLRRSLAAQLLLGTLVFTTIVCYVPQIATFVGNNIIAPGQLWRMAWPIPLAALLTVGWMVWEICWYVAKFLKKFEGAQRMAGLVPLVLVAVLVVAAAKPAYAGVTGAYARGVYAPEKVPLAQYFRFDPVFRWMQHNIKKPSVIMAKDPDNLAIAAYSANANVVSLRGDRLLQNLDALERRVGRKIKVPQGELDVHKFYSEPPSRESYQILRRHKVDYVMALTHTPFCEKLNHLPGFDLMNTPGDRYSLFAVDYKKLGDG